MKRGSALILLLGFRIAACVYASGPPPKPLFVFPCQREPNGSPFCPLGGSPLALIQTPDGNIYGAANSTAPENGGTIFKLASGQFAVLHSFSRQSGFPEGTRPGADLIEGPDGNLYGTAQSGGAHNGGVLFRLSTAGAGFEVLHNFCSSAHCADGSSPNALIAGTDGNLYGTTRLGGINACAPVSGCGTVFRFAPTTNSFTVLHAFDLAQDGYMPLGLVQASDGNVYGDDCGAAPGNGNDCGFGSPGGYLFRVTPDGQFSTIATLPDPPWTGLVQNPGGGLFGVVAGNCGSELFQVNLDGSGLNESGVCFGQWGATTPIFATDGNLWLTSSSPPGRVFQGAIYKLSPQGDLLQTIFFNGGTEGWEPGAPLIQLKSGKIAGTTVGGGAVPNPPGAVGGGIVFVVDARLPASAMR